MRGNAGQVIGVRRRVDFHSIRIDVEQPFRIRGEDAGVWSRHKTGGDLLEILDASGT